MVTILIGGDVCPIGRNEPLFTNGQVEVLFQSLVKELKNADMSVVNLECPLIKKKSPIFKQGPTLNASVNCVKALKMAGIDAVCLANNHIMDHGESGLRSTIMACQNAGIKYFGAGANLKEARRVLVQDINGHRFGFLGTAEHEFSIAEENSWGANPLDLIEIIRVIRKTKHMYDFLIVFLHSGRQNYRYPSPRLQQTCRFLVEEGAGAVICQHSHCAGCYEYYLGAPIVYGQGNFIFDPRIPKKPSWHEGLLLKLVFNSTTSCTAEWIPFFQSLASPGAKRMSSIEKHDFMTHFESRSQDILVSRTLQAKWLEECRKQKYVYANRIHGHNFLLRKLNLKLHFSDWLYSKTSKLMLRNVVECETHREILETLWRDIETDF